MVTQSPHDDFVLFAHAALGVLACRSDMQPVTEVQFPNLGSDLNRSRC